MNSRTRSDASQCLRS